MSRGSQWDPRKAGKTLAERGLAFADAMEVLEGECLVGETVRSGEARFVALGQLRGRLMVVVYTMRGDEVRIISFRKANSREQKKFSTR